MTRTFSVALILQLLIGHAEVKAAGGKGGGKGGDTTTEAGKNIESATKGNEQEGIIKIITGDLCEGNVYTADPSNEGGLEFIPACASCVSNAGVLDQDCYLNTWTFRTFCECDSYEFANCWCRRTLNIGGAFAYVVLPVTLLALIVIIQVCRKFPFCPLAKLDKQLERGKRESQ